MNNKDWMGYIAALASARDGELAVIRDFYLSRSEQQRAAILQMARSVASLIPEDLNDRIAFWNDLGSTSSMIIDLCFSVICIENDTSYPICPRELVKAIEHWNRGETYAPLVLDEGQIP